MFVWVEYMLSSDRSSVRVRYMLECFRDPVGICDTVISQHALYEKIVVSISLNL